MGVNECLNSINFSNISSNFQCSIGMNPEHQIVTDLHLLLKGVQDTLHYSYPSRKKDGKA